MSPDERNLLTQFLTDLSKTQGVAKDPEAAQMIDQTIRSNPDAAYVLTQHALIADQALHQAQAQIEQLQTQVQQLQAQPQQQQSSFFGGAGLGPRVTQPQAASSPWAQAAQPPPPQYPSQYPPQYPPQSGGFMGGGPLGGQQSGLGSFLKSAGTTAAGVAGGAFLFEGLSNLFGGGHQGFGGGGLGGFGGGGFGGGGPVEENVTINNYGDDDDDGSYSDNSSGDIGGDDYS